VSSALEVIFITRCAI